MASRGHQWCWWLARVVSCRTTSVVLVASRGRRWCCMVASRVVSCGIQRRWCRWLAVIHWVVCCGLGRGHSTCCGLGSLRSSCSHSAKVVMERRSVEQDSDPGSGVGQKWRPQQADGSNQVFLSRRQFSAHTKSSLARIDKRTARATGNTRYRYSPSGPQNG